MFNDIRLMNFFTRVVLAVLMLVALFAGYRWLALQPYFEYRVIYLRGAEQAALRYVDDATVRSAALPRLRGNFFTGDLHAMRAAFETVPWVHHASVRREWPNKLQVTVEEYVALGTWDDIDGRLLSVDGVIFSANLDEAEQEGKLIELAGPDDSAAEVAARTLELQASLAPVKLKLRALTLSKRYAWTAKLDNGITLYLGREQTAGELKTRVDRFVSVYPALAARFSNRIESIDMRYPNGLALRQRGQSAPVNNMKNET